MTKVTTAVTSTPSTPKVRLSTVTTIMATTTKEMLKTMMTESVLMESVATNPIMVTQSIREKNSGVTAEQIQQVRNVTLRDEIKQFTELGTISTSTQVPRMDSTLKTTQQVSVQTHSVQFSREDFGPEDFL